MTPRIQIRRMRRNCWRVLLTSQTPCGVRACPLASRSTWREAFDLAVVFGMAIANTRLYG